MTANKQKMHDSIGSTATHHLRQRAEQVLRNTRSNAATSQSDIDARKQLHELQVNQIELALQNSELMGLQDARREIEVLLARYTDLYEFAPIGYFTLGSDSTLHEVNLTGASLIGLARSKLVGRRFGAFIAPESRPTFNAFLGRVFASETKQSCEVQILNAEQRPFFARIEANADAAEHTCRLVVEDVSLRKAAELALHQSHDELEAKVQQRTAELIQTNERLNAEIAERKLTEVALLQSQETIRSLAAHQEIVKENERKRIAREIHDELGQNLMALRIDVSMLEARTKHSHPRLNAKVKSALNDIDTTIKSVRGIINNLRPPVLDLGLPAAFEWQVKEFQRRSGIDCTLNISGTDAQYKLDDEQSTALFRILQESLANVSRHAQASQIEIKLSQDAGNVIMKVIDNGIGLSLNSRRKTQSYGLIGIKERVNTLHGELIIDSRENEGTALTVIIPIDYSAESAE